MIYFKKIATKLIKIYLLAKFIKFLLLKNFNIKKIR